MQIEKFGLANTFYIRDFFINKIIFFNNFTISNLQNFWNFSIKVHDPIKITKSFIINFSFLIPNFRSQDFRPTDLATSFFEVASHCSLLQEIVNKITSILFICEKKKQFEILVSEYSEWSKTSGNCIIFSCRLDVCFYVLDFIIFRPL